MAIPSLVYRSFLRLFPRATIELKSGATRASHPLEPIEHDRHVGYSNEFVALHIERADRGGATHYRLKLKNLRTKSLRITRLRFPGWRGLDDLLDNYNPARISFFRNGHQSWSTSRSYRMTEKPLRPRLRLVSLVTSNLANLPSNSPGVLSSEMYTVVSDLDDDQSILVGQCEPFNQFVYILLHLHPERPHSSFFEIVYDFGRKVLAPGQEIELDGLLFLSGDSCAIVGEYFSLLSPLRRPALKERVGWSSWYQYYDKINPALLLNNLRLLKESGLKADFFQIDDGWQEAVGDWLSERGAFKGRMAELADAIRKAGYTPGLWLAPFALSPRSRLFKEHPEYILRDSGGSPLVAGYNPVWKGLYYGLDLTHPRCREYIAEFIHKAAREWGYSYLKCDFLFAACLRGANHHDIGLSRAEILKSGMALIREAAGSDVGILGCGMPLSAGIGGVEAMRIGPDTGDFWIRPESFLLRTGAMVGLRNSLRAALTRAPMHGALWVNDPDCVLARARGTRLSAAERSAQFDVVALSGGLVTISDDLSLLSATDFKELARLIELSEICSRGRVIALDAMDRELPEQFYNSSGYIGFFNWGPARKRSSYSLSRLKKLEPGLAALVDVRSGRRYDAGEAHIELGPMPKRGSILMRIERP
jgi:alpha-galactosidase